MVRSNIRVTISCDRSFAGCTRAILAPAIVLGFFIQWGTMKRVVVGVALAMNSAAFSSAQAFCVYADRQYSDGATLCISPTATQTCNSNGSWTKLELPQTQANACERAFQTPNSISFTVLPDRRRDN